MIRDLCVGSVQGKGVDGYREALELLKAALERDVAAATADAAPTALVGAAARARAGLRCWSPT